MVLTDDPLPPLTERSAISTYNSFNYSYTYTRRNFASSTSVFFGRQAGVSHRIKAFDNP